MNMLDIQLTLHNIKSAPNGLINRRGYGEPHPWSRERLVIDFRQTVGNQKAKRMFYVYVYNYRRSLQSMWRSWVNTLRPRQNGRHFADDTFKRIFLKENVRISIKISLKFVPENPIDNIPALFQIMAWRRPGDKPLFEPMMVRLPTHICVTRPQCVNIKSIRYPIRGFILPRVFHGLIH